MLDIQTGNTLETSGTSRLLNVQEKTITYSLKLILGSAMPDTQIVSILETIGTSRPLITLKGIIIYLLRHI